MHKTLFLFHNEPQIFLFYHLKCWEECSCDFSMTACPILVLYSFKKKKIHQLLSASTTSVYLRRLYSNNMLCIPICRGAQLLSARHIISI